MTANLLRTKLHLPPVRAELVSRPRLLERLDAVRHARLTLLSAPAGYGKTTLLSEWVSGLEWPVAWLSLDREDNDVARFLAYLVAALRTLGEGIGGVVHHPLQSSQQPSPAAVLTPPINDVTALPTPALLVLDDYHLIAAQPVHDALAFLLDHLPHNLHLAIATRADPPLALTRLRGQGQLVELRQSDLRFTPVEASAFLCRVAGLSLAEKDVNALTARTEGWVVGLQMAALSLRGRADVPGFIEAFTGSHRLVLDYLVEEVLEGQTPDLQDFLLQTSILDRMTASLCNAVTGRQDGHHLLGELERGNLFLIPLDDERAWYRYHHLFTDLLRDRLLQAKPDSISALHLRASEWFEVQGLPAEAVGHALQAGAVERAAALVEGNVLTLLDHRELTTLMGWLEVLPQDVIRRRPWLCVAYAWVLAYAGRLDGVERWLEEGERALGRRDPPAPALDERERRHITGHVAAVRAFVAGLKGDAIHASQQARRALERLPERDSVTRSLTATALTYSMRLSGDLAAATQAFTEAVDISRGASDHHVAVYVLCELAQLRFVQGKLHQAAETARRAVQLADEAARRSGQPPTIQGFAYTRLSAILCEWNELQAAVPMAREGVELCERWGQAEILAVVWMNLARVLQAAGDAEGAREVARLGRQVASGLSLWYLANVEAIDGWIRLMQGDVTGASRWVLEAGVDVRREGGHEILSRLLDMHGGTDAPSDPLARLLRGFVARLLVAWDRPEDGIDLLTPLLETFEAEGAMGNVIGILVLQAVAWERMGQIDRALAVLERALALAEPEGYVRVFVDEGQPMARLLHAAARRGMASDYAGRLLAAFPVDDSPPSSGLPEELVEPLSERELEVLQLVAQGLSNREVGGRLHIAVGTVKNHLQNVYGKLQVHSRTQAVARCREWGLLP